MDDKDKVKIELEITNITVLEGGGLDKVFLKTTLPGPYPRTVSTQPLFLEFGVEYRKGRQYVIDNFGMIPEVIKQGGNVQ